MAGLCMAINVWDWAPLSVLLTLSSGLPGKRTVKLPSVFLYLFHSSVCPINGTATRARSQEHKSTLRMGLLLLKSCGKYLRFSHECPAQTRFNPITAVLFAV